MSDVSQCAGALLGLLVAFFPVYLANAVSVVDQGAFSDSLNVRSTKPTSDARVMIKIVDAVRNQTSRLCMVAHF